MVESEDHESEKDQKTKDMYYSVFRRFSDVLVKVRHLFFTLFLEKKIIYCYRNYIIALPKTLTLVLTFFMPTF